MADNYLEKRMEEHRSGKTGSYRPKLTPTGQKAGTVTFKFPPKRVFVTGGAHGIGRAIVAAFANAGCKVAFADNDSVLGPLTAQRHGARFIKLDVKDAAALETCMSTLYHDWGDIDIVVNNVGVGEFKPLEETTVEDFDRIIATNLRPVFITSRSLAVYRKSQAVPNGYGRIINISSTRSFQSETGTEGYSASKGGVASLTHALMMSLSPYGITVNAISPGWIVTDESAVLSDADKLQHPSHRAGTPDDIARVCMFLALPENDFINGENIVIDGGMTRKMIYVE